MRNKVICVSVTVIFVLLLLAGCSNSNRVVDNEKQTSNLSETAVVGETTVEVKTDEETTSAKKESKFELPNLPDDFLEFSKYVGQDISIFGVDTSNWDFNVYSIQIGRASLFEMTGNVSIVTGWDDKTITNLILEFDDEYYLNGERYSQASEWLEEKFGNPTQSDIVNGITAFSGDENYFLSLGRGQIFLSWSGEKLAKYEKSKPVETTYEYYIKPQKLSPAIGMTAEEVRNSSWGKPSDINKTTTAYGVHEQWVYSGNRYIYLDDGIVTAIQE